MYSTVRKTKFLSLVALIALLIMGAPQLVFAGGGHGGGHGHDITLSSVSLPTGNEMQYAERGHGHNVVIFLHGYVDSWYVWSETLTFMPSKYHCYAISHRGHGDSTKFESGYEMEDFANDLLAFMDHFNINRADLVGHSMGTVIAQRFAIDHPERTGKLVLLGAGTNIVDNELLGSLIPIVEELEDPVDVGLITEFVESVFYGPVRYPFADGLISETAKVPANVWRKALYGLLAADYRSELHLIQAPTMILWGDQDVIFLEQDQIDLLEGIPNSQITIWEDVGHGMEWEDPERAANDIANFLH